MYASDRGYRFSLALSASLVAGVLTGCADKAGSGPTIDTGRIVGGSTKQMTDVEVVPGFLPKPDLLQRGAAGQAGLVYISPNANFASYNKVILDPVTVWAAPDSQLQTVPSAQRQAMANAFYSDLYNALKKVCRMTTTRGPGTLHMRFALVDAKIPNAAVNTVATYAPYASTAYSVGSLAFNKGVGFFAGTATAEGYATDAATGTLIWQGVDKRGGTTTLVANTLDDWRDVRHAFEAWSERLAARMQELGACQGGPGAAATPVSAKKGASSSSKPQRVKR